MAENRQQNATDAGLCLRPSISTSLPDEVEVWRILRIGKMKVGVKAWVVVESRSPRVLQLVVVDWQELQNRAEVEKLVDEDVYRLAGQLSRVNGASGHMIYVQEHSDTPLGSEAWMVLWDGGQVPCPMRPPPVYDGRRYPLSYTA